MKSNLLRLAIVALLVPTIFSSCATIFGKSSYPLSISSNPSGAEVSITNKKGTEVFRGQTPATAKLKSGGGYFAKAEFQVKIKSPGHSERIIPVNYKINGWYFGNILLGGVIGMLIIDPATGAMWKIDTPAIYENFERATSGVSELQILDISNVPESAKRQMVKIH